MYLFAPLKMISRIPRDFPCIELKYMKFFSESTNLKLTFPIDLLPFPLQHLRHRLFHSISLTTKFFSSTSFSFLSFQKFRFLIKNLFVNISSKRISILEAQRILIFFHILTYVNDILVRLKLMLKEANNIKVKLMSIDPSWKVMRKNVRLELEKVSLLL